MGSLDGIRKAGVKMNIIYKLNIFCDCIQTYFLKFKCWTKLCKTHFGIRYFTNTFLRFCVQKDISYSCFINWNWSKCISVKTGAMGKRKKGILFIWWWQDLWSHYVVIYYFEKLKGEYPIFYKRKYQHDDYSMFLV